jgi:excisionase family DNA binding protein
MNYDNLNVEEFAALSHMTENLVRQWIREEKIKAKKLGKSYSIPRSELDRLLMVDKGQATSTHEVIIAKLQAENKTLKMQLDTVKTFLKGASSVIGD